jgi:hypothetical protein
MGHLDVVGPKLVRSCLSPMSASENKMRSFLGILLKNMAVNEGIVFLPPWGKYRTNHLRQQFSHFSAASGGRLKSNSLPLYVCQLVAGQQGSPKLCVRRRWKRLRYASTRSAIKTTVVSKRTLARVEKCGPLIHAVAELEGPSTVVSQAAGYLAHFFTSKDSRIFPYALFIDFTLYWRNFVVKRTAN